MDAPIPQLYVVEVDDQCDTQLVGHSGCRYASPPQPPVQALALVRALLGGRPSQLDTDGSPWRCAIAGGRRTIRLHAARPDGQLHI